MHLHAERFSLNATFSNATVAIPNSTSPIWLKSNKHSALSPHISSRVTFSCKLGRISSINGGTWLGTEMVVTPSPGPYVKIVSAEVICPKEIKFKLY